MTLYNCKTHGDQWCITKFDSNLDVESSYFTTLTECECPAGHRHTCRHRQMLPRFLAKNATQGQLFYNFDHKTWHQAEAEVEFEPEESPESLPPLPSSITMLDLAKTSPATLHNTIAKAVGEPTIPSPRPLRRI